MEAFQPVPQERIQQQVVERMVVFSVPQIKDIMEAYQLVAQEHIHAWSNSRLSYAANPKGSRGGCADHLTGARLGAFRRTKPRCTSALDFGAVCRRFPVAERGRELRGDEDHSKGAAEHQRTGCRQNDATGRARKLE